MEEARGSWNLAAGEGFPHSAFYIPHWNRAFVLSYFRTSLHIMVTPHSPFRIPHSPFTPYRPFPALTHMAE